MKTRRKREDDYGKVWFNGWWKIHYTSKKHGVDDLVGLAHTERQKIFCLLFRCQIHCNRPMRIFLFMPSVIKGRRRKTNRIITTLEKAWNKQKTKTLLKTKPNVIAFIGFIYLFLLTLAFTPKKLRRINGDKGNSHESSASVSRY